MLSMKKAKYKGDYLLGFKDLEPVNENMSLVLRAYKVLNKFQGMGFNVRGKFIAEVFDEYPEFNTVEGFKTLEAFWRFRNFNEPLILKMEALADNLKEAA